MEQQLKEKVRLYGWVEECNDAVRALLFGELVKRALPIRKMYHSDFFHDAVWVNENVRDATEFFYIARDAGSETTRSLDLVKYHSSEIASGIHIIWRVELLCEQGGEWFVEFTQLSAKLPEVTIPQKIIVSYLKKELPGLHPKLGIARDIESWLNEDGFTIIPTAKLPSAPEEK